MLTVTCDHGQLPCYQNNNPLINNTYRDDTSPHSHGGRTIERTIKEINDSMLPVNSAKKENIVLLIGGVVLPLFMFIMHAVSNPQKNKRFLIVQILTAGVCSGWLALTYREYQINTPEECEEFINRIFLEPAIPLSLV